MPEILPARTCFPIRVTIGGFVRLSRRVEDGAHAGAVLRPKSSAQVCAILEWAQRTRTPVVPFGLGSGVCGAVQAQGDQVVMDMSGMNRILEVNETSLTVVAQPGVRGSDFERALAARGYTMGHFRSRSIYRPWEAGAPRGPPAGFYFMAT
jgi:FAD/FMN-containing dehydrogenase